MPVRQITTTVDIDAPPDHVWKVLTDLSAYPDWNPFIVKATGRPEPGGRLILRLRSQAGWSATNKVEVVSADPGVVLGWTARLAPIPGLVRGRHEFRLITTLQGTRLVHSERFSGALVAVMSRMLLRIEKDFESLNAALKKRVEGG